MCLKIRCDGESEKFCKICWELNKDFVNNATIALLNGEMIKIKVIDLEKLYNFVVYFFHLN